MKPLLFSVLPRPPHPTRDGLAIRNYHLLGGADGALSRAGLFAARPRARVRRGTRPRRARRRVDRARRPAGRAGPGRPPRAWPEGGRIRSCSIAPAALARSLAAASARGGAVLDRGALVPRRARGARGRKPRLDRFSQSGLRDLAAAPARRPRAARRRGSRGSRRRASGASRRTWRRAPRGSRASPGAMPRRCGSSALAPSRWSWPTVSTSSATACARRCPSGEVLFFVGDLSWPPNADAVRWLHATRVAGVEARAARGARRDPRTRCAGGPARPRRRRTGPFSEKAPTRGRTGHARRWPSCRSSPAGGTRLKILEAAASGVPVVATPVGAEGLEFAPETEILLRDDAPEFAAAVAGLLADRAAARRQARGGAGPRRGPVRLGADRRGVRARARAPDGRDRVTAAAHRPAPSARPRSSRGRTSSIRRSSAAGRRRSSRFPLAAPGAPLSVEVVLAAADEESVIAARVENLLGQAGVADLSVAVGCDGCRDRHGGAGPRGRAGSGSASSSSPSAAARPRS